MKFDLTLFIHNYKMKFVWTPDDDITNLVAISNLIMFLLYIHQNYQVVFIIIIIIEGMSIQVQ
jgi:hypothetical protein